MQPKFGNSSISVREVIITAFFDGWCHGSSLIIWAGTRYKLYTYVTKELKLKVRKFWGLIPTFVEVAGESLAEQG